jgi:hypothetical protein
MLRGSEIRRTLADDIIVCRLWLVQGKGAWIKWMETTDAFAIDPKLSFSEIVVPTMDSVRNTYLLHLLLMKGKHLLMVGGTGTGKTINISQYLMGTSRVSRQGKGRMMMMMMMMMMMVMVKMRRRRRRRRRGKKRKRITVLTLMIVLRV